MTSRVIAGWTVEPWRVPGLMFKPTLRGPWNLFAFIKGDDELVIEGLPAGVDFVTVPLVAISALIVAHEEWLALLSQPELKAAGPSPDSDSRADDGSGGS